MDDKYKTGTKRKLISFPPSPQAISQCHHQVKNIQRGTRRTGGLPGLMAGNVVSSLSARLQEVTERFRKEQGDYLKCEFLFYH